MPIKLRKPNLAAKPEPEELDAILAKLPLPLLGSPKYDGIRVSVQDGKLYSRSLKLIPNKAMQKLWGVAELEGLDGEICVGPPTAEDCFNRSTSTVMSRDKSAKDSVFYVFDMPCEEEPFGRRLEKAGDVIDQANLGLGSSVRVVKHTLLKTHAALLKYEEKETSRGHEGIMLRDPNGAHKQGRSTLKEVGLIAVKRFVDAEAVVLGAYEQEENTNAATIGELGQTKRSSHKAGKVGKGTLGGFVVQPWHVKPVEHSSAHDKVFNIGTGKGLTAKIRAELWAKRESLAGKIVKYRYQACGTKTAPRIPVFLGFRDGRDLQPPGRETFSATKTI